MKLEFNRSLDLPVPADRAWALLAQIDKVAACLPGAAITEQVDAIHYRGQVSVRLGPVNMNFSGTIEVLETDAATRTLRLAGKGSDKGGTSVAEMELTATVAPTGPDTSRLTGQSTVNINGKAAAMSARLMGSVSERLIKDFFANLLMRIEAEPALEGATAATPQTVPPSPPAGSLDGFAFIWSVVKSFLAGLWPGRRISS
ncbi:SRPBCC family protein [Aquabacter sp. CN5-332]|uniref:SRPBCC family protein n=1 Tax=Aquabacter sp. CN5-332 TaxID=3156608 RepID=UPI0032B59AEC